jgi:ferredoxin
MVFYFSGTGNSRYVAKKIAKVTGDEIISINQRLKDQDYNAVSSKQPLVFVGPIYAGRFPRVMDDYIKRVEFTETKCAYFIGTCAQTPWRTAEYVEKLCEKKSFSLFGFHSIIMPQGYVVGGGTQQKEVNDKILKEAEPKIEKIAETIRNKQMLPKEQPGRAVMSKVLNPIMYSMIISARSFTTTAQCTGCGQCKDRCPLNNIKLVNSRPIWGKNCTHCMACIAGCPSEAIEYGKKTQGKPRYYLGDDE